MTAINSEIPSFTNLRAGIRGYVKNTACPLHTLNNKSKSNFKSIMETFLQHYAVQALVSIIDNQNELDAVNSVLETSYVVDFSQKSLLDLESGDDLETKIANKYLALRKRSKHKQMDFDLTLSDIRRIYSRKRCQITGTRIDYNLPEGNPQKLSFERIDNTKGYTKDNVVVCAAWVNSLKCYLFESPGALLALNKASLKNLGKVSEFYLNSLYNKK
jgi:hypothetical protein